jgi:hypothetical protein
MRNVPAARGAQANTAAPGAASHHVYCLPRFSRERISPGSATWPRSVPAAWLAVPRGSARCAVWPFVRSSITSVRPSRATGCSAAIRR